MLTSLYLKNYTLIKEQHIELADGLTIFTGESGAGKSVIIGALELLVGARANTQIVRYGESKAVIEGGFDIQQNPEIQAKLTEHDFDSGNALLIRREISTNGQNRVFINDSPASKQMLAEVTRNLLDIHGQHDHQHLLSESDHIQFLDAVLEDPAVKTEFNRIYRTLSEKLDSYQRLNSQRQSIQQRVELITFQLNEIADADLSEDDENTLKTELKERTAAEDILGSAGRVTHLIQESEPSVATQLTQLKQELNYLKDFDESVKSLLPEIEQSLASVNEVMYSVDALANRIDVDPERLQQVQERLYLYETLKRKYGNSVNEIHSYQQAVQDELERTGSVDEEIAKLESEIKSIIAELKLAGDRLTAARETGKTRLENQIIPYFERLGMPNARLNVRLIPVQSTLKFSHDTVRFNENGFELVEFWIRTNKGAAELPLAKSASGGELSRIMLALKSILAERDQVGLLVFDEIDSGISGAIADSVGQEIADLARQRQVICVTHSPQIAGKGHRHFHVSKIETDDTTITEIQSLTQDERVQIIAGLISGGDITDQSRQVAENLIQAKDANG